MIFSAYNIVSVLVGYVLGLFGGHLIVSRIVNSNWRKFLPKLKQHHPLPMIIGYLDRFIYITSILVGAEEFVAVWLVLKMAGEWNQDNDSQDRPLYHLFLLGNGLNVVIGALIGFGIKYFLTLQ